MSLPPLPLNVFEDRLRQVLRSKVEFIELIGEDLAAAGGKRLRPSLVYLATRVLGGRDEQAHSGNQNTRGPVARRPAVTHHRINTHTEGTDHGVSCQQGSHRWMGISHCSCSRPGLPRPHASPLRRAGQGAHARQRMGRMASAELTGDAGIGRVSWNRSMNLPSMWFFHFQTQRPEKVQP